VVVDGASVAAEDVHGRVGGGGEHVGEHVDGRTEAGTAVEFVERTEEEWIAACLAAEIVVDGGFVHDARGAVSDVVAGVP
jgi:hypothetical protein